jgi:tRNA modification GTPase
LLVKHGARLAAPGEFTLRAYLNGRIDLAQAEAVGDIIASQNKSQLNIAMHQMRGGLSHQLNTLREDLLNFISLVELELDFGEEDVEFADRDQLRSRVEQMKQFIQPMINSFQLGNAIKNGIPVAIVGRPNAGKSSLLNALLEDDRAIVSDIAGTTRDTIEEEINIQGVAFRFIDTAGIRQTTDVIEKIGIDKAIQTISKAQIVICIFDLSHSDLEALKNDINIIQANNPSHHLLLIGNKQDIVSDEQKAVFADYLKVQAIDYLFVSMKEQIYDHATQIRQTLYDIMQLGGIGNAQTIISNARHHQQLIAASEALNSVLELLVSGNSGDILSFEMRRAVDAIGDITGTISNDEVLGNIFGKFCIGK